MTEKALSEQTVVITGGATGIGRSFAESLVEAGVESPGKPRPGFIPVRNMAKTLIYALSIYRNVNLEDISIYAR